MQENTHSGGKGRGKTYFPFVPRRHARSKNAIFNAACCEVV